MDDNSFQGQKHKISVMGFYISCQHIMQWKWMCSQPKMKFNVAGFYILHQIMQFTIQPNHTIFMFHNASSTWYLMQYEVLSSIISKLLLKLKCSINDIEQKEG